MLEEAEMGTHKFDKNIETVKRRRFLRFLVSRVALGILILAGSVSIVTTFGIVYTLLSDTFVFFSRVSVIEVLGTDLAPLGTEPKFVKAHA